CCSAELGLISPFTAALISCCALVSNFEYHCGAPCGNSGTMWLNSPATAGPPWSFPSFESVLITESRQGRKPLVLFVYISIWVFGSIHHLMNASAAALCFAVTGIASPSGRPNDEPGPFIPGISAPVTCPATLDCDGVLAVGIFPGPEAN